MLKAAPPMDKNEHYCVTVLPQVSRTFAPTIRRLPRPLFLHVTVAYLLCRVADTIEDSIMLDVEQKQNLLDEYASLIKKENPLIELNSFMARISLLPQEGPEYGLVHNLLLILSVYTTFPRNVRKGISTWVAEMTSGMRKYVQSKNTSAQNFLKTLKELDDYIYYVAGTVGNLSTALFSSYSSHITNKTIKRLNRYSESFGKGLQLVNIIRDMPSDWECNRSYIPNELLKKYDLTRRSIFDKHSIPQSKKMIDELIHMALSYLDGALQYIVAIPKAELRIRLSCLLPLFWALQTLRTIKKNINLFFQKEKIKISRAIIREELYFAYVTVFSNRLIQRRYLKFRDEIRGGNAGG
jgi:farnesyl-diphosphate farnesyltransferase